MEIHRCGFEWVYCDGKCAECEKPKVTTSNHT